MASTGMTKACEAAGGKDTDITKVPDISASALSRSHEFVPRAIELEEKMLGKVARRDVRPDFAGERPHSLIVVLERLTVRLDRPPRGCG